MFILMTWLSGLFFILSITMLALPTAGVAQVVTETDGLKRLDRNTTCSFDKLLSVFSRGTISVKDARSIVGEPFEVNKWLYGEWPGNRGRDTMVGWNYRCSECIQLTGFENVLRWGAQVGIGIATNPELGREARLGLQAPLTCCSAVNVNATADANDQLCIPVLVKGPASHDFTQSIWWLNKIWTDLIRDKELLGFEADEKLAPVIDEQVLSGRILSKTGFLGSSTSITESSSERHEYAWRALQRANGLEETGVLDEATEEAILNPRHWFAAQIEYAVTEVTETVDPEGTVSLDLAQGTMTRDTPTPFKSTLLETTESGSGTGAATSTDPTIDRDLAARLSQARAAYPEYAPTGKLDSPSNTIDYGLIGDDDRKPVFDHMDMLAPPASSVVQILFKTSSGSEKSCSGAMIAPDTVLTAAHCIHSGTIKGHPFTDFTVIPGRNSGAANFGKCDAVGARLLQGWVSATTLTELLDYDLGAIKLDCQIGRDTGWFGMRALAEDEEGLRVVVQGYASDKTPKGLQWFAEDVVRVITKLKGFHQADTFGGTSGAPVYAPGEADLIVGVHSNTFFGLTEPWKSNNGFTRITPQRLGTVQGWIDQ